MPVEYWSTVDLAAAARFAAQGLSPEVVPQKDSHLALFRFERSERFEQVAADLDRGVIVEHPETVEKVRRALRTRGIIANAAQRGRA